MIGVPGSSKRCFIAFPMPKIGGKSLLRHQIVCICHIYVYIWAYDIPYISMYMVAHIWASGAQLGPSWGVPRVTPGPHMLYSCLNMLRRPYLDPPMVTTTATVAHVLQMGGVPPPPNPIPFIIHTITSFHRKLNHIGGFQVRKGPPKPSWWVACYGCCGVNDKRDRVRGRWHATPLYTCATLL